MPAHTRQQVDGDRFDNSGTGSFFIFLRFERYKTNPTRERRRSAGSKFYTTFLLCKNRYTITKQQTNLTIFT